MLPLKTIKFYSLSYAELVDELLAVSRQSNHSEHLVTLNPEIWVDAQSSLVLRQAIATAKWVTADGIGLIFGQRWLGLVPSPRLTGADITTQLLSRSLSVFLIGSTRANVELAVQSIHEKFATAEVVGYRDGFFDLDAISSIANHINSLDPDIVLVGMGSPRQDKVIQLLKPLVRRGVFIGVGGVIDLLAGTATRAPIWMQRLGVEWVWRVARQPSRLSRLLRMIPRYLECLIRESLGKYPPD